MKTVTRIGKEFGIRTIQTKRRNSKHKEFIPNLQSRIDSHVTTIMANLLNANYRIYELSLTKTITPNLEMTDYCSKSCKYPKKITISNIYYPKNWYTTVYNKGLSVLNGLFTLSAIPTDDDSRIFESIWIKQSRGYQLNLVRGYIAMIDDVSYHAKTIQTAKMGLTRKLKMIRNRTNSSRNRTRLP
jgi:hypothetical protein